MILLVEIMITLIKFWVLIRKLIYSFFIPCILFSQTPQDTELWGPVPKKISSVNFTTPPSDAIILFDGKGYEKSIGFNHEFLDDLPPSLNKMIAGDIKIEDISKFNNKDFIIDISGSLENNEGKKDIEKINNLLNLVKKV